MVFDTNKVYNGLSSNVKELIGAYGFFGSSIYDIKRYVEVDGKFADATIMPMTLVEIHKEDTFVADNGLRYNFFYLIDSPEENWINNKDRHIARDKYTSLKMKSKTKVSDATIKNAFDAGVDWEQLNGRFNDKVREGIRLVKNFINESNKRIDYLESAKLSSKSKKEINKIKENNTSFFYSSIPKLWSAFNSINID